MLNEETGVNDKVETPSTETQTETTEGKETASSPSDSGTPTGGGETPAGKTYTEEEVNRIMHERTKDYASMKRDLESYRSLGSAREIQEKLKPAPATQSAAQSYQPDEDDKKFLTYLGKLMPNMSKLDLLAKLEGNMGFIESLRQEREAQQQAFVDDSQNKVFEFCDSIGAKDDSQKAVIRDAVAAAILNDPKLAARWDKHDASVITDAIKVLETTLGKRTEVAAKQDLSAGKAKVEKIQAPLPKGGVGAPIVKERKLDDDERAEAAWKRLKGE